MEVKAHAPNADVWIVDVRLPTGALEGIVAVRELAAEGIISIYPVFFISVMPQSLAQDKLDSLKSAGVPIKRSISPALSRR